MNFNKKTCAIVLSIAFLSQLEAMIYPTPLYIAQRLSQMFTVIYKSSVAKAIAPVAQWQAPSFVANIAQPLPSLPVDLPALPELNLPASPSATGFTMPSNNQLAALGVSVAALYGIYKYRQAYIASTPELIEEALEFVGNLIEDPLFFYREEISLEFSHAPLPVSERRITEDVQRITKMPALLEQKKLVVVRALGLIESFLNPRLSATELEFVNTLFNELQATFYSNVSEFSAASAKAITTPALKIYWHLLQARNIYKPNTLKVLLDYINKDETFEIADAIFQNNTAMQSAYKELINYIDNPSRYYLGPIQPNRIADQVATIDSLKSDLIKRIYGTYLYQKIILSTEKKNEIKEFEDLFEIIKRSVTKHIDEDIKKQAIKCRDLLIAQLPEASKWLIVEAYLNAKKVPFSFDKIERGEQPKQESTSQFAYEEELGNQSAQARQPQFRQVQSRDLRPVAQRLPQQQTRGTQIQPQRRQAPPSYDSGQYRSSAGAASSSRAVHYNDEYDDYE